MYKLFLILFMAGGQTTAIPTMHPYDTYEGCMSAGEERMGEWIDNGLVRGFGCLNVKMGSINAE